jgi:LPXTG-motif cell wall-anchored protein
MKILSKVAALAVLLVGLVLPAAAAGAQQTYPAPAAPEVQSSNDAPPVVDDGEVLAEEEVRDGGAVLGVEDVAGTSDEAPSGALPLTGGDVVGLAAIGAAAVGIGALLVRRSRSATSVAA